MAAPQIVPYDPAWPSLAEDWIARLRGVLSPVLGESAWIERIGSTAVPGLAAKPFLDLQLTLTELPEERRIRQAVLPLGFARARGARPTRPASITTRSGQDRIPPITTVHGRGAGADGLARSGLIDGVGGLRFARGARFPDASRAERRCAPNTATSITTMPMALIGVRRS